MRGLARVLALTGAWMIVGGLAVGQAATDAPETTSPALRPVDWRYRIGAVEFVKSAEGEWVSPKVAAAFPFDELIYWWDLRLPRGEGFRLHLQVEFKQGDESPWLYAGFWGDVKLTGTKREQPQFDRGKVASDQLLLKEKARSFRFKVVSDGTRPLSVVPSIGVITTDNKPDAETTRSFGCLPPGPTPPSRVLDVPLRLQQDTTGTKLPDRCQSAAVAAAMEYFGRSIGLEEIILYTTDPEYNEYGIWPRTIGTAMECGFETYIDRFRDWDAVRRTLAENKVILCSITMPRSDDYIAPPYPSMGGHIVALNGVTDDGRVIITDSAGSARKGGDGTSYTQWYQKDFEKIWMKRKGGVGMVICPPRGARERLVKDLPPFPLESRKQLMAEWKAKAAADAASSSTKATTEPK